MFGISPWAILGALALVIGAYFYGHHQGVLSEKAALAERFEEALTTFAGNVEKAATAATAQALKNFQEKTAKLEELAESFKTAQGVMNAASAKLSASLKGSQCLLTPVQRQLLECVRRPGSTGCSVGAPVR